MLTATTIIDVNGVEPEQIEDFFLTLDKEKYLDWHPEHIDYKMIRLTDDIIGSEIYFKEKFDKLLIDYTWKIISYTPGRSLTLKAKYFYPIQLYLSFDQNANGTTVLHAISLGFEGFGSKLFDAVISKTMFTTADLRSNERHAIEEFKRLKTICK